jgi:hypothetical protein
MKMASSIYLEFLDYPWLLPQFAVLLANTYVGQSHFVHVRWD